MKAGGQSVTQTLHVDGLFFSPCLWTVPCGELYHGDPLMGPERQGSYPACKGRACLSQEEIQGSNLSALHEIFQWFTV